MAVNSVDFNISLWGLAKESPAGRGVAGLWNATAGKAYEVTKTLISNRIASKRTQPNQRQVQQIQPLALSPRELLPPPPPPSRPVSFEDIKIEPLQFQAPPPPQENPRPLPPAPNKSKGSIFSLAANADLAFQEVLPVIRTAGQFATQMSSISNQVPTALQNTQVVLNNANNTIGHANNVINQFQPVLTNIDTATRTIHSTAVTTQDQITGLALSGQEALSHITTQFSKLIEAITPATKILISLAVCLAGSRLHNDSLDSTLPSNQNPLALFQMTTGATFALFGALGTVMFSIDYFLL